MSYRIRTVSEMTGIPRNTLIAWERRYGFVRPSRHENGYRSYSESDVERLLRIRNAVGAGLKISEAIELLKKGESPDLAARRAEIEPSPSRLLPHSSPSLAAPMLASDDDDEYATLRAQLLDALIHYRGQEAERLLGRLVPLPFEERIHRVFFPILQEIGDLWERKIVNVAQEHYASALIRDQLVGILVGVGSRDAQAPHAVCTTLPDEHHEIGALALGVHLGLRGYRVSYLGANLPLGDLLDFCASQRPALVCISAIRSISPERAITYAATLRAGCPPNSRVVIGGRGVLLEPPLIVPGVEFVPKWNDFRS